MNSIVQSKLPSKVQKILEEQNHTRKSLRDISLTLARLTAKELITSRELMERLQISEPTLIKKRKQGIIPFLKISGKYRYDWQAVLSALSNPKTNTYAK